MKYKISEFLCLSLILTPYLITSYTIKNIRKFISYIDRLSVPLANGLKF